MKKRAVRFEGLSKKELAKRLAISEESSISHDGVGCDKLVEPIPHYDVAPCEKVIAGENNSFIVFGRDRPSNKISGYGGKGHTQCGSIDIVVGRMSAAPSEEMFVDPNMRTDAARVLISQRSDVDKNFKLAKGQVGESIAKSCIVMKADALRLIAREGIKIITNGDDVNSLGGRIAKVFGIDLIAGNDDADLQPLVKGNNLRDAMKAMIDYIDKLIGFIFNFILNQIQINSILMAHTHQSPSGPTSPSIELASIGALIQMKNGISNNDLYSTRINLKTLKLMFLEPIGEKYICSRNNNSN